jgi:ribokinase
MGVEMTNRDAVSPDALVLTHALEKLRARDGLSPSRLENSRSVDAAPLLDLASVRRHAAVHDIDFAHAAFEIVAECVRDSLYGSQRVVADAILALGLFSDAYANKGIESGVIEALKSDLLGRRRKHLLKSWRQLQEALDLAPVAPPSDRALRGTVEAAVLRELAHQLMQREIHSLGAKSVVMPVPGNSRLREASTTHMGKVVVVGGAVMDATFRVKELPQVATSTDAFAFDLAPGGKGVMQAVAASRLGLDVSLVAAVTNDRFGHEIVDHLRDEGVDTSLLKVVNDARTPFTGVIEFEMGDSIALNWANRMEVRLDVRDVDRLGEHLTAADAVLVTFEVPPETMQRTLDLVSHGNVARPVVIVTPGQPYPDARISGQAFSQIDYLVAHPWELGRYAPPGQEKFDLDAAARQLLAYGVETLCVPTGGGCTIYSQTSLGTFSVPAFPSAYLATSAARDAFCAALAAKLIEGRGRFSEEVALWATAAMAAAIADYPIPNPMPERRRVEQLLKRSRYMVTPRHDVNDEGDDDLAEGRSA